MNFSVEFYENKRGKQPVKKFLGELKKKNPNLWKKTLAALEKIQHRDYHREPLTKHLGEDLLEIRIKSGKNIARIIFTFRPGQKIILLHGFIKKSQKTPQKELEVAKRRLLDLQKS